MSWISKWSGALVKGAAVLVAAGVFFGTLSGGIYWVKGQSDHKAWAEGAIRQVEEKVITVEDSVQTLVDLLTEQARQKEEDRRVAEAEKAAERTVLTRLCKKPSFRKNNPAECEMLNEIQ